METDNLTIQVLPFSKDTEEAVLGAAIVDAESVPELRGIIKPEDFYLIRNRMIWAAVCALDDLKTPIDLITISEELDKHGQLDEVGGPAYLTGLINSLPWQQNIEAYGNILHSLGTRRQMIGAATYIANLAADEAVTVEDMVSKSTEALQDAANGLMGGRAMDAETLASAFYDRVGEQAEKATLPGMPTGFYDLDTKFGGGLQFGEFTLLVGFPGIGKTGCLDSMILHIARSFHVDLYTLEMTKDERMNRMVSQLTGINSQRLRSGKLTDSEWPKFVNAIGEVGSLNLRIDDTASLSMATLRARVIQRRAMGKLDLVVVDYAGLMQGIGESEYQQHSYLSRNLKMLAQETGCHVLAAHQFNRKGHEYEKPSIFHMRGSGTWEQDANNVLLLYEPKDAVTGIKFLPRVMEIGKQRNGPTGTIDLQMEKNTTKFESVTRAATIGGE